MKKIILFIFIFKGLCFSASDTLLVSISIRDSITTSVHEMTIPTDYALRNNYPNPFNANTVIRYELPEYTHIRIIIYDLSGKAVTTLVDESQNAGFYDIAWNAVNMSSGIYLIRLESRNYSSIQKCILIK